MRNTLFVLICLFYLGVSAHAWSAPSKEVLPDSLVHLFLPLQEFRFGMSAKDLEQVAQERLPGWPLVRRETLINVRRDVALPSGSKIPYLQSVLIADRTAKRAFNRTYSLFLTSPLTSSELYAIRFDIKPKEENARLPSLQEWLGELASVWGTPHAVGRGENLIGVIYYLNDALQPMPKDGGTACVPDRTNLEMLLLTSPETVAEVAGQIESSGCRYKFDSLIYLGPDGNPVRSVTSIVDTIQQARDAVKRVTYGLER